MIRPCGKRVCVCVYEICSGFEQAIDPAEVERSVMLKQNGN